MDGPLPRLEYLFAAYTAIFILLFLYIRILARRNQRLEREIDDLKEMLGKR
jgi:CcmD family protein